MVRTTEHDPFTLLELALRESDWVLADLVACLLLTHEGSRERLHGALAGGAGRPGAPDSLVTLHRWAELTRTLGLDNGGD